MTDTFDSDTAGRRAITVRLDVDVYDALEHAGELRGSTSMSETLRMAALRFIAESAQDADIVDEVRRKQEALRVRADALRNAGQRRPGQVNPDALQTGAERGRAEHSPRQQGDNGRTRTPAHQGDNEG